MKIFFAFLILIQSLFVFAEATREKNTSVGAPPNAVSRGQSESSGISDSPTGTTNEEAKRYRTRAESMGGAPNVGGGMGTGTGAGSTVGHETGEGTLTSGATSGEAAEE